MSEYQYYEFQAVERPLTPAQIAELRKLSSRAKITPTQLQNVYHWGDFRGEPLDLLERYFDAFVYVANWGTNRFMVRLPEELVDLEAARAYEAEEALTIHTRGDAVILEFVSHEDEGGYWIEDEEAASWMPDLLPVRAELANGDLRALSIAWLSAARSGLLAEDEDYDEDEDEDDESGEREPPVPPGLGRLSASLDALARFLRVDEDLIAVAAERSADLPPEPALAEMQRWAAALPAAEKDDLLGQLAANPARAQAELMRRFRQAAHAAAGRGRRGAHRRAVTGGGRCPRRGTAPPGGGAGGSGAGTAGAGRGRRAGEVPRRPGGAGGGPLAPGLRPDRGQAGAGVRPGGATAQGPVRPQRPSGARPRHSPRVCGRCGRSTPNGRPC